MIHTLFSKDIAEVLTVFSISPGSKFQRKDLKEKTCLNNVNLDNAITTLINAGILKKEKRSLSLNLENARQIISLISSDYKLFQEIPLDAYFCVLHIAHHLSSMKGVQAFLFGSYAKLVFRDDSDIDVAIISDSTIDKRELYALTRKLKELYKKEVQLHYFNKDFYKNKRDPLVSDIIRNGKRIM